MAESLLPRAAAEVAAPSRGQTGRGPDAVEGAATEARAPTLTTGRGDAAPRLEALDAPRWIASIQIVFSHFYIDQRSGRAHAFALPEAGEWWPQFARYGKNWTQFFFVLSGFVLAYAEMSRPLTRTGKVSQLQYLRRRLITIYPTFLFSMIVYVLQVRTLGTPTAFQWAMLAPSVLLMQSWVVICGEDLPRDNSSFGWNVPAWFLSALVVYWLILRPVAGFFRHRSLAFTCQCLLALWAFSMVPGIIERSLPEPHDRHCLYLNLQNGSLGYFHVFIAGVAAARIFILTCLKDAQTGGKPTPATEKLLLDTERAPAIFRYGCCVGYAAYVVYFMFIDMEVSFLTFHNGGILPILLLILWGAALGADPLAKYVFQSRPFLLLGQLSYAQYLMQMPVFMVCLSYAGGKMDFKTFPPQLPSVSKAAYPFALVAVGYFVQRCIQRPYAEWQRWRQEKGIVGTDEKVVVFLDSAMERCWHRCQSFRRPAAAAPDASCGAGAP